MNRVITAILILLILPLHSCKKESINPRHTGELYLDHATDIAVKLETLKTINHLWKDAGWWSSACLMDAMLDYAKNSGADVSVECRQIFNANKYFAGGGFKNRSYDDCAWWAIAWLKAYDLYGNDEYLQTAQDIFSYMVTGGWDTGCNGGMAWHNTYRYKNAITNELFILLAARLAQHQTEPWLKAYYTDWSVKAWTWLNQSGVQNAAHLYNDGLDDNCNNNGGTAWSYNQGVILGALKELYVLTDNIQYLQSAQQTAYASMSALSNADTILTEPCGRNFGEDAAEFKGPYIKYLSCLNTVLHDGTIKQFIIHNAAIVWANDQNLQHLFDAVWAGPYQTGNAQSTGTVLDLMNAATIQMRQ